MKLFLQECPCLSFLTKLNRKYTVRGGHTAEYRHSVAWSGKNDLLFNIAKTKEMVVDLRRSRTKLTTMSILGEKVEMVQGYKYPGVHLTADWTGNAR